MTVVSSVVRPWGVGVLEESTLYLRSKFPYLERKNDPSIKMAPCNGPYLSVSAPYRLPNIHSPCFLKISGLCPSGNAWVDHATENNTAHAAYTECSNMGVCDRSTGRCGCRAGFTGEACQRLTCPADCSNRGRCMSMRDAASVIDGQSLIFEGVYEGWDADMIHGCLCDDGWEGYDCSLRLVFSAHTLLARRRSTFGVQGVRYVG